MSVRGLILSAVNDTFVERPLRRLYELVSPSAGAKYDRQTRRFLRRILNPDSNCVDIGCYRGEILKSIIEAAPAGVHHAFEPVPWNCDYLRKRFALNRIHFHQVAVSDAPGTATFEYVKDRPARSRLGNATGDDIDATSLNVKVTTVDDTVGSQPISFLKIDVEGNELKVLRGARNLLLSSRPYVLVEFDRNSSDDPEYTAAEMWRFTEEVNYGLGTLAGYLSVSDDCCMNRQEFLSVYLHRKDFYFLLCPLREK